MTQACASRAGGSATATAVAVKAVPATPRKAVVEELPEEEKALTAWPTKVALAIAVLGALAMGTVLPFWLIQIAQQAAHMM